MHGNKFCICKIYLLLRRAEYYRAMYKLKYINPIPVLSKDLTDMGKIVASRNPRSRGTFAKLRNIVVFSRVL